MSIARDRTIYFECKTYRKTNFWNNNMECSYCNNQGNNIDEDNIEIEQLEKYQYQHIINQEITKQNEIEKKARRIAPPIQNKGWININKNENYFRLFYINPHGFGLDKIEKLRY